MAENPATCKTATGNCLVNPADRLYRPAKAKTHMQRVRTPRQGASFILLWSLLAASYLCLAPPLLAMISLSRQQDNLDPAGAVALNMIVLIITCPLSAWLATRTILKFRVLLDLARGKI